MIDFAFNAFFLKGVCGNHQTFTFHCKIISTIRKLLEVF